MFAILKTGGKQYTVSAGDVIRIEKVEGDVGKVIEFPQLMIINDGQSTKVGSPLVSNSLVKATILEQTHEKTVIVYKKRRRQGYDRKNGHRQLVSVLHIDEIVAEGKSIAKAQAPTPKPKLQAKAEGKKQKPVQEKKKIAEKPAVVKKETKTVPVEKKKAPAQVARPEPVAKKIEEKKPVAKKAAVKQPAAKKQVTQKPVAKKPVAKKTKE